MIDLKPACRRMTDLVAGVSDAQLGDSTPCTEYTVRDLIDHVDQVSRAFTAIARKEPGERAEAPASAGGDWRAGVSKAVLALGDAWDSTAAWQGMTEGPGVELPNERWGKIALTEMVVHGWDLAGATGQQFGLPGETLRACFEHVAEFVPNAPVEGLWGPPVEAPADAPLLDRIVAVTGRRP
ncbi:TIGR03086 family metal-binding protein [Streptomyces winkii]|uniref:TIGR03086 family metal-binding protein n=1 Tax=Streptomyces winkii TaxID=3051178 RepID=UPI0028D23B4B|nr:TIGR03086 family metal-binding protein [Streptomyces sp. DSM 40971]